MKKIVINTIIVLIIAILVIGVYPNKALGKFSLKDISKDAQSFIEQGQDQDTTTNEDISNIVMPIAQILIWAASIIIVVVTAIMAIKYMVATPDDKAKLKTQLIGLVVSTIVIFGAQFIWSTLYEFLKDM